MSNAIEFYQGRGFTAELIRTDRKKTATIQVENGLTSVIIPEGTTQEKLENLITKRTKWIKEKLYIQSQYSPVTPKEYVSGESFSYMGKNYRLKVVRAKNKSVKLINGRLTVALPEHQSTSQHIQLALIDWYRTLSEKRLQEKTARYAKLMGVTPSSVGIKSFKSRWGSCHVNGDIVFNWKIVMAPNRIVDYVVVHELCHLKHHDHSPKFWKAVEKVIPDYKDCKRWLKDNATRQSV